MIIKAGGGPANAASRAETGNFNRHPYNSDPGVNFFEQEKLWIRLFIRTEGYLLKVWM